MSITIPGLLLIPMLIIFGVLRPHLAYYTAIFFVPFSGTALINFEALSFGLSAHQFSVLLVIVLLALGARSISCVAIADQLHPAVPSLLLFCCLILFSVFAALLRVDYVSTNFTMPPFVFFGTIFAVLVYRTSGTPEGINTLIKVWSLSITFVSVWGFFQLLCALTGLTYPDFLFNTSASDFATLFAQQSGSGWTRIGSVAVEPSILTQSLSVYMALAFTLLADGHCTERWPLILGVTTGVLCCLISTSTTGYVGLVAAVCLIGLDRPRFLLASTCAALVVAGVLLMASGPLQDAVLESTLHKTSSWSFQHRVENVLVGVEAFRQHPLLGAGWGSISILSLPFYILANLGLIGLLAYALVPASVLIVSVNTRRALAEARRYGNHAEQRRIDFIRSTLKALNNALIVSLVMQCVAGPTFVFPDYWFLIGFALASNAAGRQLTKSGLSLGRWQAA